MTSSFVPFVSLEATKQKVLGAKFAGVPDQGRYSTKSFLSVRRLSTRFHMNVFLKKENM